MSLNSSTPSNSSLVPVVLVPAVLDCSVSPLGVLNSLLFYAVRASLVLPLSILVLHLGHQQWRQQRSAPALNHSDVFTYHLAVLELVWLLGVVLLLCGLYSNVPVVTATGKFLSSVIFYGENLFHLLTGVERYLAAVHPVVYVGLKTGRGVRIRNVGTGCAWLLCLSCTSTIFLPFTFVGVAFLSFSFFCILVFSFCSLSVLYVLLRPGPGGGRGRGPGADGAKQRALITLGSITGAVWLWLIMLLIFTALMNREQLSLRASCMMLTVGVWSTLPGSLVLPLLYLHRAGKLSRCCRNSG